MKLSTGCVNLEGYSYDILDEFLGHNCPMYILPEDKENLYVVKNGELVFTTTKDIRKGLTKKKEHSLMIRSDGSKVDDPLSYNEYRFTTLNKTNQIKKIKTPYTNNKVAKQLLIDKKELFKRAKAMESEDFEDLLSIAISIESDPVQAKQVFLNLYNAQYREKLSPGLSLKDKRTRILKRYKEDFNPEINIEKAFSTSLGVNFEY
jgi:hypothetical protein